MKVSVIVFPGSNCDRDVAVTLEKSMGARPSMVWHGDTQVPDCDLIVLPGGFASGDYLRCGDVGLRVERNDTVFSAGYDKRQVITIPIAHHDGNYFADDDTLDRLEGENRVAFRYCNGAGETTDDANPNGSARGIAGIYNGTGTVLGMMPHPERLADRALGGEDGRGLFDGLAEALR